MKEVSGYNISEQEFKKISKWAEDVYNIAVIVDYFVGNQPEIEECNNLAPVIKNLRNNADLLNAFFICFIGNYLKGFVFADHAGVFPYKGSGIGSEGYNSDDFLASLGFGIKINLPGSASLRLSWGFPLMRNSHEEEYHQGRFHFELSLQPDFDALVKLRKPKNAEKVKIDDDIKFVKYHKKEKTVAKVPKRTVIKSLSSGQKIKLSYNK